MPVEPSPRRAIAFIDGQNLFHAARETFGHTYPNYDVRCLAERLCRGQNWQLAGVCFYTGVPSKEDNDSLNHFWAGKLAVMGRQGVRVFTRPVRYHIRRVRLPNGANATYRAGVEKGIDVRIAIDVLRMAQRDEYDVALILSQDQDLSEVVREIPRVAREQKRWIRIACAFPVGPTTVNPRGIEQTDWIHITRALYDACLDRRDYRSTRT